MSAQAAATRAQPIALDADSVSSLSSGDDSDQDAQWFEPPRTGTGSRAMGLSMQQDGAAGASPHDAAGFTIDSRSPLSKRDFADGLNDLELHRRSRRKKPRTQQKLDFFLPAEQQHAASASASAAHRREDAAESALGWRQLPRAKQRRSDPEAAYKFRSTRTWIGGQWRGATELFVMGDRLDMRVWKAASSEGAWHGEVEYARVRQFGFPRSGPPHFFSMELVRDDQQTDLSVFYDILLAETMTTWHGATDQPEYLYGVLFFFDDDLELKRFQSLGDTMRPLDKRFHVLGKEDAETYMVQAGELRATSDSLSAMVRRDFKVDEMETSDDSALGMNALSLRGKQRRTKSRRDDVEVVVQMTDESIADETKQAPAQGKRRKRQQKIQLKGAAKKEDDERKAKLLLSYPFEGSESSGGRITITNGDVDRLAPGEFLNDTIIDFYFRFLWRHLDPWQQENIYFFSPHFYSRLSSDSKYELLQERFKRVSRWTAKEHIFSKRLLFVPVNDSCHWSVAVICNPGSAIISTIRVRRERPRSPPVSNPLPVKAEQGGFFSDTVIIDATDGDSAHSSSDDEVTEVEESRQQRLKYPPCILFLDSLRCHQKRRICSQLRSYLECEYMSRHGEESAAPSTIKHDGDQEALISTKFDGKSIELIEPDIPLQSNSSDCGVFLLMYAIEIIKRFPGGVTKEDIEIKLSSSVSTKMFDEQHVLEFRDYLHQLLYALHAVERRGGNEMHVRDEGLEFFAIDQ